MRNYTKNKNVYLSHIWKKLTRDEFIEIHTILKSKTKMRIPDLPEFEEDYGINADKNSKQKEVTGTLASLHSLLVD